MSTVRMLGLDPDLYCDTTPGMKLAHTLRLIGEEPLLAVQIKNHNQTEDGVFVLTRKKHHLIFQSVGQTFSYHRREGIFNIHIFEEIPLGTPYEALWYITRGFTKLDLLETDMRAKTIFAFYGQIEPEEHQKITVIRNILR